MTLYDKWNEMIGYEKGLYFDYDTELVRITTDIYNPSIAFLYKGVVILTAQQNSAVIFSRYNDNPICADFFAKYWLKDVADLWFNQYGGHIHIYGIDGVTKIINLLTIYPEWPDAKSSGGNIE